MLLISAYFDITEDIYLNLRQLEMVPDSTKDKRVLISVDIANARGRAVDFIASNQLFVVNEDSDTFTFETIIAKSNVDLTITNSLLNIICDWKIEVQESRSDHKLISFKIKSVRNVYTSTEHCGKTFIIKRKQWAIFD